MATLRPPGAAGQNPDPRTRPIRAKLTGMLLVPLVALVALWGLLAVFTLGSALNEHKDNQLATSGTRSSIALLSALEQERLQTFLWLSAPRRPPASQLAPVRRTDDAAIAAYQRNGVFDLLPARRTLVGQLGRITAIRTATDAGSLTAPGAFSAYSGLIDAVFEVYLSTGESNVTLYQQTLAAIDAGRALEQFIGEITLVDGAGASGELSAADRQLFAAAVTSQRLLAADALAQSDGPLRTGLQKLYSSPAHARVAALENVIGGPGQGSATQAAVRAWNPALQSFLAQFIKVTTSDGKPLGVLAGQVSNRLFLQAALAGGLGLLAVAWSVLLMLRIGRGIRRELTHLHDGAEAMASERLPGVIARLRAGDEVDADAESPPLEPGRITEISRVAAAFSVVQRTAVSAAVGEAALRKGIGQVFLSLSLRSQSLLHRQFAILDEMERAARDPATLADLFRLDHLTSRMRRHAEGLTILSGATPPRGWRDPVPVLDVLRGAIAEIEDYTRVDVAGEPPAAVLGAAVNDVIHLLAELIENAAAFSPPTTRIAVRADVVGVGLAVEIEDRGFGLSAPNLASINERLATRPEFDLASGDQLGLFVVGQLAARQGIRVRLRESSYGGTVAIVLLPRAILALAGTGPDDPGPEPASRGRAELTGPVLVRDGAAALMPAAAGQPARAVGLRPLASTAPRRPSAFRGPGGRHRPGGAGPDRGRAPGGTSAPGETREPGGPADLPAGNVPAAPGSGLPRRVRQASMAPQLRDADPESRRARVAMPSAERSPGEARSVMSALQDGWRRGRTGDPEGAAEEPRGWPGSPARDGGEAS
jgi:signal transduction histidine kinase